MSEPTVAQKISALKQQKLVIEQMRKEGMVGAGLARDQAYMLDKIIEDYEREVSNTVANFPLSD